MWTSIQWALVFIIFNLKISLGHDNKSQAEMMNNDDLITSSHTQDDRHFLSFNTANNDFSPEKLQRPFQKHRWKFNLTTFSFIPLDNDDDNNHDKETRTMSSSLVPKNNLVFDKDSNFTESLASFATHSHEAHQIPAPGKLGVHEDEENELLPWKKEEDVNLFKIKVSPVNNSTFVGVPSVKPKPKLTLTTTSMTTKAVDELITMPDQLNDPGDFEDTVLKQNYLEPQGSYKNIEKEYEDNLNTKMNADIELFKIQANDDNDDTRSVQESSSNDFLDKKLLQKDDTVRNLEGEGDDVQLQNLENEPQFDLIPQLVNVTTENVYVPVDSDDEDLSDKDYVNVFDYDIKKVKYTDSNDILDLVEDNENKGNKSSTRDGGFSEDFEVEQGNTMMMMRRRPRRSVVHLYDMVVCATGCNPLIYKGYGCFCGFMGSGYTVDGIDKCCFMHDNCYHHARCPPLLSYFVPYYWTCNAGRPQCVSDFRGWKGLCGTHLCECDRQFAECLRNYPCPRSRAMCMTSPFRFWQGLTLRIMRSTLK